MCLVLLFAMLAGVAFGAFDLHTECPYPSRNGGGYEIGGKMYSGCLPNFCFTSKVVDASTPACEYTSGTCDYAVAVKNVGCRQCTQSTDPMCTTANLTNTIMGSTVKAAYCNDKFLVIHSTGLGNFEGNLDEIPFPPGGTSTWGTGCRTRSQYQGYKITKIPLTFTLLPTSTGTNNVATYQSAGAEYLKNTNVVYGLAADGPIALSVNGQEHFPVFNNNAQITAEKCEVDSCNQHVGQGGGPAHLHGDPYGPHCMYDHGDYVGGNTSHPPVTGWGLDGPLIYGRYLDATAPGASVVLDDCGGHIHDAFPYHYHAQVTSEMTDAGIPQSFGIAGGQSYPSFSGGVYKCFKADISKQSAFFKDFSADATNYQPCCDGTQAYVAPGITLSTVASAAQAAPAGCNPTRTLAAWIILTIVVAIVVLSFGLIVGIQCCRHKRCCCFEKRDCCASLCAPCDRLCFCCRSRPVEDSIGLSECLCNKSGQAHASKRVN